jgi:hypothetical protein
MNEMRRTEPKLLANHPVSLLMCNEEKTKKMYLSPECTFIEEIHARAETITPCLKDILDFKPPPYWRF